MQSYRNEPPVLLADLNEYITCKLCKGYLIDAVSITECLHPFCKSCIVKYLNERYDCPSCGILIHQSHPLNYISFDRTLQDIVYKVVPDLRKKEKLLRESFYRMMGKSPPASEDLVREKSTPCGLEAASDASGGPGSSPYASGSTSAAHDPDCHRNDEQVNVQLEPGSSSLEPLEFKYLRLSSRATVTHLRKYVAQEVLHDISRFRDVVIHVFNSLLLKIDIFILNNDDGTFLGRDHVLKFVRVVYWNENEPMPLQYRFSHTIY